MGLSKHLNFGKVAYKQKKKKKVLKIGSSGVQCFALFIYHGYYTNIAE